MMVSLPVPLRSRFLSAIGFLAALLCVCGCASRGLPAAARRPVQVRAVGLRAPTTSPLAAGLSARTHPLYHQAQAACRQHQYAHAADLLARLAVQPGLSTEEAAFVQQQRILCLQDAGLPLPAALRLSVPSSAAPLSTAALPALSTPRNARSADEADCGPRALLLLCEKEGIVADLPHLRQLAGTTREGTSLAGLARAAQAVGLQTQGVQVSREALPDVDMPALAYVNGNHFIAVLSMQGRGEDATATVHDPNNAHEQTLSQERLLRLCSGYLLLAHK